MYRYHGRQKRLTIGRYPVFLLAEAREQARGALRLVETGRDPQQEKLDTKKAPNVLFPEHVKDFIERYAKPKNRQWQETEQILLKNAVPVLKHHALDEVTRQDILGILDNIIARGAPVQANRFLANIRKLFNWAISRGLVNQNPAIGITQPTPERARDRVLSDSELKEVWSSWNQLGWPFGPLYQLLLVTAQRRGEVAHMKWSDISDSVWTIPREIAKNDRTHHVPLTPLATELLKSIPRVKGQDLVFSTNGRTPVSGFSKGKCQTDKLSGISNWRLHDLRRTAASGMARLGTSPHVVEKILNHSSGTISGVAAVYNRYGYYEEKRAALLAWSNYLSTAVVTS